MVVVILGHLWGTGRGGSCPFDDNIVVNEWNVDGWLFDKNMIKLIKKY